MKRSMRHMLVALVIAVQCSGTAFAVDVDGRAFPEAIADVFSLEERSCLEVAESTITEDLGLTFSPQICAHDRISPDEERMALELEFIEDMEAGRQGLNMKANFSFPHNPEVERSIEFFRSGRMRERFTSWLERSGRYRDVMSEALRNEGLPDDLVYLALIESGFNPKAFSRAKASGPWQFIESTGRRFGLAINWWVDERRDPVKSAKSAARYLKDLYARFGVWDLAMAAYNAGEGRIEKARARARTDDFWKIRKTNNIRTETKDYVPLYIAATRIAKNPVEYGFDSIDYQEPLNFDEVVLTSPIDLAIAAALAGVDVQEIKDLNPELKQFSTPPYDNEYVLRLPTGSADNFLDNVRDIPPAELVNLRSHTVARGQTLAGIARKYGVSMKMLREMNPNMHKRALQDGEVVYLPAGSAVSKKLESAGNTARKSEPEAAVAETGDVQSHRIGKGDTLAKVATRYRVPVQTLIKLNPHLKPSRLKIGDSIRVPGKSA